MRTPGIDHLVLAAGSLEPATAWLSERLGVDPAGRARHARYGTHNALWNLDDGTYLELIAVDPDAPAPGRPRWFALDRFAGPPRLVHWVLRLPSLSVPFAAEHGRTLRLSRDELSWSVSVPDRIQCSTPIGGRSRSTGPASGRR